MRPKFDRSGQNQPRGGMPSSMERLSSSPQKVEKNFNRGYKNNHLLTMHWYFRTIPQNHHTFCILWFPPQKKGQFQTPIFNFPTLISIFRRLRIKKVSRNEISIAELYPTLPVILHCFLKGFPVVLRKVFHDTMSWACLARKRNGLAWFS